VTHAAATKTNWNLWAEFCNSTGRETNWGKKVGEELTRRKILPCKFALDVGCGTGEFTTALATFTPRIEGIDVVDIRKNVSFPFHKVSFELYKGDEPDVLLFKQSLHLLQKPDSVSLIFPRSTLVIAQMPKPEWDTNPNWAKRPLNAELNAKALRDSGRTTDVVRMEQSYTIGMPLLRSMFLAGYTSDLRRLKADERSAIWEKLRPAYEAGAPFIDTLDIIIALPRN
jgi:hypothetical protein